MSRFFWVGPCVGATAVSLHASKSDIPSFAFGSHVVLSVQVALLLFYGALLLLVPVVRALFDGALPVELSLILPWKYSSVRRSSGSTLWRKKAAVGTPGVRMKSVAEEDDTMVDRREKLVDMADRVFRERDEDIAEFRAKLAEEPVEPDPGLKELVDTQDEFRERIMGRIERIIASARF